MSAGPLQVALIPAKVAATVTLHRTVKNINAAHVLRALGVHALMLLPIRDLLLS